MARVDLTGFGQKLVGLGGLACGESLTSSLDITLELGFLLQLGFRVLDQRFGLGVLLDSALLALGDLNDLLVVAFGDQVVNHGTQAPCRRLGCGRLRRPRLRRPRLRRPRLRRHPWQGIDQQRVGEHGVGVVEGDLFQIA